MTRSSAPRPLLLVGALAAALLLSGCASASETATPSSSTGAASPSEAFSAGALQDPSAPGASEDAAPAPAPVSISIPSIGVNSSLEALALGEGGRLDAPVDFDLAGWYSGGVAPGQVGPAIIAGHVDSITAPAVFARIGELKEGDEVIVTTAHSTDLTFEITGSTQSAKAEFPTADVYSNVPTPELRLITCTGDFDSSTGHYLDNLIVFAELRD